MRIREERAGHKVSGVKDHWSDNEAEPRYVRVSSSSAIEDKMIREEVNGRAHNTSRAGRPKSGAAENVRSVVSRCHAVPNVGGLT
jgi:hypothetical protein